MTITELKEIVDTVLLNANMPASKDIAPEMSLRNDLGMGSLMLAELTVRIEDKTSVDVFENGIVDKIDEVLRRVNG